MRIINKTTGEVIEVDQATYRLDQARSFTKAMGSRAIAEKPEPWQITMRKASCGLPGSGAASCKYLTTEEDGSHKCAACGCHAKLENKIINFKVLECPLGLEGFSNQGHPWHGFSASDAGGK